MRIEVLDHLVLTVADIGRTRDFYERMLEGPVRRTGATGPIMSVYFRDPEWQPPGGLQPFGE